MSTGMFRLSMMGLVIVAQFGTGKLRNYFCCLCTIVMSATHYPLTSCNCHTACSSKLIFFCGDVRSIVSKINRVEKEQKKNKEIIVSKVLLMLNAV